MFTALIGAPTALLTLSRWHDHQISRLDEVHAETETA
jgi:hypothetical protein